MSGPTVEIVHAVDDVGADEWNGLLQDAGPFLRHEFLAALETTGCVSPATGWHPRHLVLRDGDGRLCAAMPMYLKDHSWGEFVFDWSWADAFHRHGRSYYPKLVCAVPFTPVTGPRLLVHPQAERAASAEQLVSRARQLAVEESASSLHVLFPREAELADLRSQGLMLRKDCQFHWRNEDFRDFDDFLKTMRSDRRKKTRRERRRVAEAGIEFRHLAGDEVDDDLLERIYAYYAATFLKRGHPPYMSLDFFRRLRDTMPGSLLVVVAEKQGAAVACAIFFRDEETIYGRYWGCESHYHSLHFETCFYQGIEYCIRHGIERFEPGAQGEHKLRRGFHPTTVWSTHWLADPAFAAAIGDYLDRERDYLDEYMEEAERRLPFRQEG